MGVQADQLERVGAASTASIARGGQAVLEPEAELRVELAGLDVVVGVGLDPRA